MDSKEESQQQPQNPNAAALADPTSTSQAMHNRSSAGALSPRQPQPQPQWRQLGIVQRGRGRPRKYAPPNVIDGGDGGGGANANNSSSSSGPPAKRSRGGRLLGSRNKQKSNALGGEGGPLRAHVIDVNAGEDIAMKILEFINQEPRDVCILSASGVVSTAVLHSDNPLGFVNYVGLYVIIHMSMSCISSNPESDGTVTKRTASLHVSLAGPDFKVVGGRVSGMLIAASQVKVIVGTSEPERVKPANVLSSSGGGSGFSQSRGLQCSSESSEENDTDLRL